MIEEQNWTLMPPRPDESPREHLEKIGSPEAEKLGEQGRINRIILLCATSRRSSDDRRAR
jgi:hypothetical protein